MFTFLHSTFERFNIKIKSTKNNVNFFFSESYAVPPKFTPPPSNTAVGNEGESLEISLQASGNPTPLTYTWTKEGAIFEDHGEMANKMLTFDNSITNISLIFHRSSAHHHRWSYIEFHQIDT